MAFASTQQYQLPSGTLASLGQVDPSQLKTLGAGVRQAPDGTLYGPNGNVIQPGPMGTAGNTGVTGGMAPGGAPAEADQSLAGMSPEQQYWAAVKGLGWNSGAGNTYRGQQQQLVDYLGQHGAPGWQGGGMKADDWLQDPTGGQHDIITSGGQLVFNPDSPGGGGGGQGGGAFGGNPGNLIDDPGYQFQLGEGMKALQRSAAARGTLLTGGTLKGLEGYAQNFANTAYQNAFNRNMGVAQMGLNAANDLTGLNRAYGQSASGLYGDMGNAQAAGTIGRANQWTGALGDLGNLTQQYMAGRQGNGLPGDYTT